jgi:transposase-like protein
MRRKFTETDRQRYLAELKASGETPWSFARRVGVTPANLYRWMRQPGGPRPQFARLVRERPSGGATSAAAKRISIQIGDALVHVEAGFDPGLLRDVVAALSGQEPS